MTTDQKNTTDTAAQELDAWEMSLAIVTGMKQAYAKAEEERLTAIAANPEVNVMGNKEARKAAIIRDTLSEALKELEYSLGQVARANNLAIPRA